ncbi:MAG TPA: hypothetical protein PLH11_09790 [Gemmobacter sp.]|nr:hypothetical protein [Gemmobacter sp.]
MTIPKEGSQDIGDGIIVSVMPDCLPAATAAIDAQFASMQETKPCAR